MKDRLLYACMVNRFRCVRLFVTLRMVACQDPLSMGFSRHEYWSMLPCPPPGDLPNPRIELASPAFPSLQVDSLPLSHWGSPKWWHLNKQPFTSMVYYSASLVHLVFPKFYITIFLSLYYMGNLSCQKSMSLNFSLADTSK